MPSQSLDKQALLYMTLLAVQFGVQPILTQHFTPPSVVRSTVILTQEVVKFFMAYTMLHLSNQTKQATKNWSIQSWLSIALVPACLYAIQNMAVLTAHQNLDALTFNVLNQTKTLSAALCCYFIMGKRQSTLQMVALILLLVSALVMEGIVDLQTLSNLSSISSSTDTSTAWDARGSRRWTLGVVPVLLASFISGLAGALSQRNLQQGQGRNPYLFSMELCAASVILLTASLAVSGDGTALVQKGFWQGWSLSTGVPILTSSAGGILVGLVTKHAGSVRKGFALIFGILLSGVIQAIVTPEQRISTRHIVGGVLAGLSLYLHSTNPPQAKQKAE